MKAVVCAKHGPPKALQLKDIAKPFHKNNAVYIKINATAVTPIDCFIRAFKVGHKKGNVIITVEHGGIH